MHKLFTCLGILTLGSALAHAGGAGLLRVEDIPKAIATLTKSPLAKERARAAEQLGRRGSLRVTDVKDAIEPLMNAVKADKDDSVRAAAATALGLIATEPTKTVERLTEALNDKAMPVKLAAVKALGQVGPEARSALPELRKMGGDTDKALSKAAKDAMKLIGKK